MYLLGLDIGSSSVKAALVNARSGAVAGAVHSPDTEMDILARQPDWAEQDPEIWWENCRSAIKKLLQNTKIGASDIAAIGISYQMHGLVTIGREGRPLRPAIIWCDSRAVTTGEKAYRALGEDFCLQHYLNSPGNFTASKLKWVKEHEPELYGQIRYAMLPGDYIAFRMTGEALTTVSGLSEGILWDFTQHDLAQDLLDYYGIGRDMIPPLTPTFARQGGLTQSAAAELGLTPGTPVTYRAGDQPNNALSLNVLNPGEVAATGGTSGVVYGVVDKYLFDRQNRVNSFAHVNHRAGAPRIGVLLCINGAGSQYAWIRKHFAPEHSDYPAMEQAAASVPVGSGGLCILPFGNGAERMLNNRNPGAQISNLHFHRHSRAHVYRAALEGVAFSFVYGMNLMQELGLDVSVVRAGNDNLFQSAVFASTIANTLGCRIEVLNSTGAAGAAVAAGVGIGLWHEAGEGLNALERVNIYEPAAPNDSYPEAYERWSALLEKPTPALGFTS